MRTLPYVWQSIGRGWSESTTATVRRLLLSLASTASFFYDELAKPRGQRQMPMYPMMGEAAIAAFEAWQSHPNQQAY
ncbi:hypothetical protein [Oscillatoria sp. CS-180]|uniref:hypothetical protein n=1 Tax=Oscillatoria sp. CS-180 TaxID=3021720 RepID=UPI00232ACE8B|nr:hypothetical protein [Oscillatoria sp. CS-180]